MVLGSWIPPTGSGTAQGTVAITPVTQSGIGGQIVIAEPITVQVLNNTISQTVVSANQLPQLRISEQILGAPAYAYIISPPVARTDTVTNVSGSSTITDAAIATGDSGKAVAGTGIPIVSYVGTVVAGVRFTLVDAFGNSIATTANVTTIVVGAVDLTTIPRSTGATLPTYVLGSAVGQIGGPAGPLDGTGKLPVAQLPTQATGVLTVTAGNGTIVVNNTDPANPTVRVGVGIPEASVTNLTTDLAARLASANNLSDVANAGTSRTNLGLGGAAVLNVGTTAGSVAAGDDTRIINAVQDTIVTTKGDLLVATANATIVRLGIGENGTVLTADSTQTDGLKWAVASAQPKQAGTGLLTGTFGPGGATGQPTTLCPSSWRVTIAASVGDLLVWYPSIISTGADAQGDLASIVGGSPVNFYSNAYGPTQAANGHGGLYLSGDFGIANYTPIKWLVQSSDLSGGNITLAFLYQGTTGSHVWGHASIPSQIDVINYGAHG